MYKDEPFYYNLHMPRGRSYLGLLFFVLAYPATHYFVQYIPNPFVPNANLAMNMIFPVLAGYFYGPLSGAVTGLLGTGLSAVIVPDVYDALSILPHTLMGIIAGLMGKPRLQFLSALSVLVGHALNVIFYWRFGQLEVTNLFVLVLGLITETTIDVVAIMLLMILFHKHIYREDEQRW